MAEEKHIRHYTITDIERYWSGQLTPAEMNAMERAALDDPFLADALEGYEHTRSASADLTSLKEKLDQRIGNDTLVIPFLKRKNIKWIRVAAAIIIIIGVGLFLQQMVFKNQPEVALSKLDNNKNEEKIPPNVSTNEFRTDTPSNKLTAITADAPASVQKQKTLLKNKEVVTDRSVKIDTTSRCLVASPASIEPLSAKDISSSNAPLVANAEKREESGKQAYKKPVADTPLSLNEVTVVGAAKPSSRQANFSDKNTGLTFSNKYNYRVVDAQNNPVPFANVMNTRDNVGTYTDIRGNFNLLSSDSTLNVQIKSLGYNSAYYNLAPTKQPGDLVLKEDEAARNQILAQNRKVVGSLSRKDSAELEEPEVGWGFYNTYVANNIKIPQNIRSKNAGGEVELSFDIDKTGQPVNIRVTRSSQCKECDEEAIRLLREGPKWKRKNKKKAKVSIAVDPE